MIKAIIFDCFGVIIGDAYVAIKKAYPEIGPGTKKLSEQSGLGQMTSEERKVRTIKLLDGIGVDGKRVLEEAISGIEWNFELLKMIKSLRKDYKIGLLSNVGVGFWRRFSKEEAEEYFDDTVLSYQVGLIKPDPRIFELAARRLEVGLEECIFVDDDEKNVRAAENCGMKGIVYEWGMNVGAALTLELQK